MFAVPVDLDVKMKALLLGSIFLIVSSNLTFFDSFISTGHIGLLQLNWFYGFNTTILSPDCLFIIYYWLPSVVKRVALHYLCCSMQYLNNNF